MRDGRDGRPGERGPRGAPGEPGPQGKQGKSLFELARENGFREGPDEFLKTLVGPKGEQGEKGLDGRDGRDGADGLQGPQGEPGARGKDGGHGLQGKAGERGQRGPQGEPGPVGPMPEHRWNGTSLQFELPTGGWGRSVDLKGDKGDPGRNGGGGGGSRGGGGSGTVTSVGLEVPDVFTVNGSPVTDAGVLSFSAVSPGFDRIMFWDQSAGKLAYLTIGSNLSIVGTTLNASGGGGGGGSVDSVIAGTGIAVDSVTDPSNPEVSLDGTTQASLALADSATQPGDLAAVATSGAYGDLSGRPTLGTAAAEDATDFATAAQGSLADSAVQPGDLATVATSGAYTDLSGRPTLATVATSGAYNDLSGRPTLGTAAAQNSTAFATAAQGALADTAVQPGSLATVATTGAYTDLSGRPTLGTAASQNSTAFATAAQGALADTAVQPSGLSSYAPLASPALTGNPTAPTATAGDNDTSIATTAFVQTAVNAGRGSYVGDRTISGTTDSPSATDKGKLLRTTSSSAVTITWNATGFTALDWVDIVQEGTGQVSLAAGSGITLLPAGTQKLRAQGSGGSAVYLGSNVWWLVGDFEGTAYQPLDATLTALAGLTNSANLVPYFSATDTWATYTSTASGRALGGIAGTSGGAPYLSGTDTWSLATTTAGGRALWNNAGTANTTPYYSASNTVSLQATSSGGRALWNAGTANTIPMFAAANTLAQVAHNTNSYTYTPTATTGFNVTAATPRVTRYIRMGNVVFVSGSVNVTCTNAVMTMSIVELSLPVASNLANTYDLTGTCCSTTNPVSAGSVVGSVANDRAVLTFQCQITGAQEVQYEYSYTII